MMPPRSKSRLTFHPATSDRWDDLAQLFGERGACGGCWCMWWKLKRSEFVKQKGRKNRAALRKLVETGDPPGILAYRGKTALGWCAVAPRDRYPVLERSRVLRAVDEQPVWSITCLFVDRAHRNRGVSTQLLQAAAAFVKKRGGRIVEGYPVEPRTGRVPDAFLWTGLASAFRAAGFAEATRRSPTRPIMRKKLR